MKKLFVSAVLFLMAAQAFAGDGNDDVGDIFEKPNNVIVKFNKDITVDETEGSVYSKVLKNPVTGYGCQVFSTNAGRKIIGGQVINMSAIYWSGEASWQSTDGNLVLTCGQVATDNYHGNVMLNQINIQMVSQLQVLDAKNPTISSETTQEMKKMTVLQEQAKAQAKAQEILIPY